MALYMNSTSIGFGGAQPAAAAGSATSENFDCYEEGTWTPATTGFILGNQTGLYTKIGRLVSVLGGATFSNTNDSSTYWTGLPFAEGNYIHVSSGSVSWSNMAGVANVTTFVARCGKNNANFSFYGCGNNIGWNDTLSSASGDSIQFDIIYYSVT